MLQPICDDTAFKPIAPPGYWDTPPLDPEKLRRLFDNEIVLPEALAAQEVHHHDHHYYGPTNAVNVAGSVEFLAVGDHATATTNSEPSTAQFKAELGEVMQSLIKVQDTLDQIDERIFDSLNQFLVVARKMQLEGKSMAEVQLKMKDTLDDIWVRTFVGDMKPKMPPGILSTLSFVLKNVIVGPVIKAQLGL